jgi:hypothetical protein
MRDTTGSPTIHPEGDGVTICPGCGNEVQYPESSFLGAFDGKSRWGHKACVEGIPNDVQRTRAIRRAKLDALVALAKRKVGPRDFDDLHTIDAAEGVIERVFRVE